MDGRGEKELREATQNGDGEVTSTIFVADAHREFRLALKNSVEVEGAAKALCIGEAGMLPAVVLESGERCGRRSDDARVFGVFDEKR